MRYCCRIAALITLLLGMTGAGAEPARLPHDPEAYTQGLLYFDGMLYESTGLYGKSTLRKVDPGSGKIHQQRPLAERYFAEGLAQVGNRLVQLTWKAGKAFVYHQQSLTPLAIFDYDTQGWGLTFDGRSLIMSDGSARLYFRNAKTFEIENIVTVTDRGQPVKWLNELEYIDGEVWANVYRKLEIVRIDPETGHVTDRLDLSDLPRPDERNGREDVLNGIAYDPDQRQVYITGKRYSYIYRFDLDELLSL